MKILILGHGGHGKDVVALYFKNIYNLKFKSASLNALSVMYPILQIVNGYKTLDEAYRERNKHRSLWKELVSLINYIDKSSLVKITLKESDIFVGLRCNLEFEASKDLFDFIIWVDASERLPLEPSMSIKFDSTYMKLVDNNGTINELDEVLAKVEKSLNYES